MINFTLVCYFMLYLILELKKSKNLKRICATMYNNTTIS